MSTERSGAVGRRGARLPSELASLLAKYDRPGPRYTSYPTAPAWHDISAEDMRKALRSYVVEDEAGRAAALSLYVHIPFCQERCLYCGCNVVIAPRDKVSDPYMQALRREMQMIRTELGKRRRVTQLHLGGGTPTYLQPAQLEDLMRWMHEDFEFEPDAEISIEVDPVVTTDEHLRTLRQVGFNRISMGVQDLDPHVQETVHRVQPKELTERFYRLCRDLGFDSVNMDLIYGLPHQSVESFARTVDQVIAWRPDRIAVFNYAHVPWIKPHQERMPAEALPEPREKVAIFLDTTRRFTDGGYEAIGIDHFAKIDDALAVARREDEQSHVVARRPVAAPFQHRELQAGDESGGAAACPSCWRGAAARSRSGKLVRSYSLKAAAGTLGIRLQWVTPSGVRPNRSHQRR